ncbi:hypothetical protein ACU4HD_21585 [Cupriavidus basilensis]
MAVKQAEARQLAHGILIIVEYGNLHRTLWFGNRKVRPPTEQGTHQRYSFYHLPRDTATDAGRSENNSAQHRKRAARQGNGTKRQGRNRAQTLLRSKNSGVRRWYPCRFRFGNGLSVEPRSRHPDRVGQCLPAPVMGEAPL